MRFAPSRWGGSTFWLSVGLATLGLAFASQGETKDQASAKYETFTKEQRAHWAYQVVKRPGLPTIQESSWVRNAIDVFILAGLESLGFQHAPEADRVALLRRVTFDLTGLPPTIEEVETFLKDHRTDAYERVVDRLLASTGYGERWTQHWLDLAHYADSNGFELDAERPDAWRYRDWVVRALNEDMPYDRFLGLQLAGDELESRNPDALVATGFGRCGPREMVGGNVDPEIKRQTELSEITGTVGSVFLGLTIGCARCHDHKFDAFPTTDYYRLQAFFAASQLTDVPTASEAEKMSYESARKAIAEKIAPLKGRMESIEAPYRQALLDGKKSQLTAAEKALLLIPEKERTPAQKRLIEGLASTLKVSWEEVAEAVAKVSSDHEERERLKRAIHAIELTLPRPPAHAFALIDEKAEAPVTHVARRGDPKKPGPVVSPRPPGVLLIGQPADAFSQEAIRPTGSTTGRRLALSSWLVRPDNPLTARVIVNRLWQHHFGRGIVATSSDFGVRGEPPSHPELLDWLATELIGGGWRLKPLHRLMVTSASYRQASVLPRSSIVLKQRTDDPDNSLLWRMNRRRTEAESLRDAMLSVSGELNPKEGGPGVLVPIEKEVEDLIFTEAEVVDLWPETPDPREHHRRSLYLFRKRNVRYPMFDAFDAPDTQSACPKRSASTHALQALVLLNSEFAAARARSLAGRIFRESAGNRDARIARAYLLVLARLPGPHEVEQARTFLDQQANFLRGRPANRPGRASPTFVPEGTDATDAAALVDFALAMLNRNEFVYVP
ncbi:MAG: PSD1 and planctomycete cytochrome C domain-containing protein [Isosphaeraceae bacterium]